MNKKKTSLGYALSLDDYLVMPKNERKEFLMDLVTESNLIEGIKYDDMQTRYDGFKEPERDGHYNAIKYVLGNYDGRNITKEDIMHMHKLLMSYTLKNAGRYRQHSSHVGMRGCPHYRHIPKLMNELEGKIKKNDHTISDEYIYDIHYMFEKIHPFTDGNGRTGRLLLNWLTLRRLKEFHVISANHRKEYFTAIDHYAQKFKIEHPKVRFYKDYERDINKMHDMILLYELQKASEKDKF